MRAPKPIKLWMFHLIARVRRWLGGGHARLLLEMLAAPQDRMAALLLEDAAGPAMVIDSQGRVVRFNAAMQQVLGESGTLAPGSLIDPVFAAAAREAAIAELVPILLGRQQGARSFATTLAGQEGEQEVRALALPLREEGAVVTGVLLRFTDISAQRQLEAQLAHSQKLQATGQLAGGIAHDFNNLLTAVIGAADSIIEREQAGPPSAHGRETMEDARQIRDSADRGAALVRQLLAFGRQQTLQPSILAVNDVIESVSTLLRRLLGSSIRLELALETPGRQVRADPTQLDQVLINLAVNARNAMPQGGVLRLGSGHISLFRPLALGAEVIPPGRYVMIEVQDNGVGIPPEVLPRIFDPFFTTRREAGGSGLGLSTVHGIVRQSDGFLAVESSQGVGTSVRIYLPRWDGADALGVPRLPVRVAATSPPRPPSPGPLPPGTLPSETTPPGTMPPGKMPPGALLAETLPPEGSPCEGILLLVDDEDALRKLAARALARAGWQVLSADSGESALELLRTRIQTGQPTIDVVVSDMMMPGMDGGTLLREVRALLGRDDLPGLLVSGFAQSRLRDGLRAKHTSFLAKPHSLRQLVTTVGDLVGTARREILA